MWYIFGTRDNIVDSFDDKKYIFKKWVYTTSIKCNKITINIIQHVFNTQASNGVISNKFYDIKI